MYSYLHVLQRQQLNRLGHSLFLLQLVQCTMSQTDQCAQIGKLDIVICIKGSI